MNRLQAEYANLFQKGCNSVIQNLTEYILNLQSC